MSNDKDSTQKSEIIKAIPAYKVGDVVVIEGVIVKLGDGKFVTMRTENGLYLEATHASIFMVDGARSDGGVMHLHIGTKVRTKAKVLLIKVGITYSSISEKSDTVYQLAMECEFSHVFVPEGEITDLYKEDDEIFSEGDEVVYAGVALEIDPFDDRPIRMSDNGNIHSVWVPGEAVISINNDPGLSYKRCCVGDVVRVSATIRRVRMGYTYPYSLKIKGAETHCMATTASSITKVQNNEPPASEEGESEEVPFVVDPRMPAGTKVLVRGTICDVNALVYPDAPPLCISWGSGEGVMWLYAEDVVSVNGQPRPRNLEDCKVGDEIVFRCALTESREVYLPTGGLNRVPAMSIIGYDDKATPVEEPAEDKKSTEFKKEGSVVSKDPLKCKVGDTVMYEGILEDTRMWEYSSNGEKPRALIVSGGATPYWELKSEDVRRANAGRALDGSWTLGETVRGVGEVNDIRRGVLEVSTEYGYNYVHIPASAVVTVFQKLKEGDRVHVRGKYVSSGLPGSVFISCANVIMYVQSRSVSHINGSRVEETPCEGVKYAVGDELWIPGVVIYDKHNYTSANLVRLHDGSECVFRRESIFINDIQEDKESLIVGGIKDGMEPEQGAPTIEIGSVAEFDGTVTAIYKECNWLQLTTASHRRRA